MTIKADPTQFALVSDEVEEFLVANGCQTKPRMSFMIAIDEILINIASYAYPGGEGNVTVEYGVEDDSAYIRFIDTGIPYNPLEKDDPDTKLSAEARGLGGLGIFMVKKSMDDMKYEYTNGENRLTIRKKIR